MTRPKVTVQSLADMKRRGEKIATLTAYDHPMALLEDRCGVDVILVGDSVANVVLGYENTIPVTLDEVIHHTRAVARAHPRALLVGDLPFMTYQAGASDAVRNAGRMLKEGGAEAVKLEGGRRMEPVIRAILDAAIPVMGHLGLTPQSVHQFGGYRVQGREAAAAELLVEDARLLETCGCFAIVLEGMPWQLAQRITTAVSIPTIGIGAGPHCDGQVLVINDMLGMSGDFAPRFVKRYAEVGRLMAEAVEAYVADVKAGRFPDLDQSYSSE
ncbi:MAG TPA: 3-methyl-2-oxobutanoate hydroxymethyltransferase [Candidatus Krumholzibacteria bacterium]|nr:3-methyl-2-oxobutanoate hydroxymethyltransferase [Candidatus Krumholzibacteria bacterium]